MAQVLSPSPSGSPFGSRPLSRTSSQKSLGYGRSDSKTAIASATPLVFTAHRESAKNQPAASIPSSAPSSPRLNHPDDYASSQPSLTSSPSSSLSLDEEYHGEYHTREETQQEKHAEKSPPRSQIMENSESAETSVADATIADPDATSEVLEILDVPLQSNPSFISMGDDAAVKKEPSRHVDYLSHAWREEDIWCSWRHIVARRGILENCERLENASWRTWTKTQRRLKTVSPETLNWMKDHDVTWLYGPLQTMDPKAINPDSPIARSRLSRADSFGLMKKPILKRRNISEAMLQRSLSNSTLVRQAVACITSQGNTPGSASTPTSVRFHDHVVTPTPSPHESSDYFSLPSASTSTATSLEATTPGTEKRHIHFNNKVEQCIAVDKDIDDLEESYGAIVDTDEDSEDDGILMMQTATGKERKLNHANGTPRGSFSSEQQPKTTIAMLPATTLKYRGDTPEPPDRSATPRPPSGPGFGSTGRKLNHSSSSETLKPSRPSNNFLVDDDDDEDPDVGWQPSSYSPGGIPLDDYDEDDAELEARGMRRTPSGMFMPYDDDEEGGPEGAGLFGRVVDTVNTARDIAHVIWNVGWRR